MDGEVPGVGGCVERELTVDTAPQGAVVYLNDQEVGRTPFKKEFLWYGTYDVAVRKEGYQTVKAHSKVIAPWWQWVPIDLLAELAPLRLKDEQTLTYTLVPEQTGATDPQERLNRAEELGAKLESSERTRAPLTRPTTQPTTRATTHPATR